MKKKILICDDDDDLRQTVRLLLEQTYDIIEASNGEDAIRLIDSEKPNLILLDVSMPGLSGLQTLETYRTHHQDILTIVLTTKQRIGIARRALNLGATEYLTKPFDPDYLIREISRLLTARASQKPDSGRPWRIGTQAGGGSS